MAVLGVGTQATLKDAKAFVTRHRISNATMVWDRTATTWRHWGVRGQPFAILLDADGKPVKSWSGRLPVSDVAKAVATLA